jgi:hypothetical protein
MQPFRWQVYWDATFYTSVVTLAASSDTGIIATPLAPASGRPGLWPLFLRVTGVNMATDETNDLTILWYLNATGAGGAIGTTTFAQMTAGAPSPAVELWPGDIAAAFDTATFMKPLPPYCKIVYTLAGTTKLMGFVIYLSYMVEEGY